MASATASRAESAAFEKGFTTMTHTMRERLSEKNGPHKTVFGVLANEKYKVRHYESLQYSAILLIVVYGSKRLALRVCF